MESPPGFSFHIESGGPRSQAVPATILAHLLQNTQRAFELIGIQLEGRPVRQRARVAADISERFKLLCKVPKSGCYEMPVVFAPPTELHGTQASQNALDVFAELMRSISRKDSFAMSRVMPDERIRRRVLELVRGMAPRPGDHWSAEIRGVDDVAFGVLDDTTAAFVQHTLVPAEQREVERTIIGELSNIAFSEHKFTVIFRPTNRELECIYDEEIEDLLYDCRRTLIQVTGRVLEDEHGNPKQLIDVSDVRNLDISAIVLSESSYLDRTLSVVGVPLVLTPVLDESEQLLCIEYPDLALDVFAPTRERLVDELAQQLDMLWNEFALCSDELLDAGARALKHRLLQRFQEGAHAA